MATTLYSKKSTGIQSDRGFTLAELLIVVAIIAVLTAIAIPVFTTQLERSREATDISNVRAAAAEMIDLFFADINPSDDNYLANQGFYAEMDFQDGTSAHIITTTVDAKQRQEGWQGTPGVIVLRINGEEVICDIPAVVTPNQYELIYAIETQKIYIQSNSVNQGS